MEGDGNCQFRSASFGLYGGRQQRNRMAGTGAAAPAGRTAAAACCLTLSPRVRHCVTAPPRSSPSCPAGTPRHHGRVRAAAVAYMQQRRQDFEAFLGEEFPQYIWWAAWLHREPFCGQQQQWAAAAAHTAGATCPADVLPFQSTSSSQPPRAAARRPAPQADEPGRDVGRRADAARAVRGAGRGGERGHLGCAAPADACRLLGASAGPVCGGPAAGGSRQ